MGNLSPGRPLWTFFSHGLDPDRRGVVDYGNLLADTFSSSPT
jgi:hypothetical protein